jgi:hypothetical protein
LTNILIKIFRGIDKHFSKKFSSVDREFPNLFKFHTTNKFYSFEHDCSTNYFTNEVVVLRLQELRSIWGNKNRAINKLCNAPGIRFKKRFTLFEEVRRTTCVLPTCGLDGRTISSITLMSGGSGLTESNQQKFITSTFGITNQQQSRRDGTLLPARRQYFFVVRHFR